MQTSQMEEGLRSQSISFIDYIMLLFLVDCLVVGFVHVDVVHGELVWSSLSEDVGNGSELGRGREV